jgi:hypothetical protein
MGTVSRLLVLAIAILASNCAPEPEPRTVEGADEAQPRLLCRLADPRIRESSGIAASPTAKDVFYTHNDSGDTARFFRFTAKGEVTGAFQVSGAAARDWEDMAAAKIDGRPWLYLGDIGDNAASREEIVVYRVAEPTAEASVAIDQKYTLKYPDGAHNAECLMVHPKTGDLYIVTKVSSKPAQVFWLPKPERSGEYGLNQIGTVKIEVPMSQARLITGGAISPDGKFVVVRTYLQAYEFSAPARFSDWPKTTPRPIQTNAEIQGEAITYSQDGKTLVTTSEGSPCPVSTVPIGR